MLHTKYWNPNINIYISTEFYRPNTISQLWLIIVYQKAKSKCILCVKYVRVYERGYPSIFLSTLPRQIPGYIIIKTTLS